MFRKLLILCLTTNVASCQRHSAPTFAEFVDRYLDDFARRHPSIAAGNGLHEHDDRLDDFTATGIAEEIAALKRDAATLAAFDTATMTPDERVDRLILAGIIDGWLDEGFASNDPRYRLARLSDALTRICRLLSGIRVHTKQWTLADAQRCFEEEAYVATPAAKREAERAVYDPTYGGYFLGKRGILKLRADMQAKMGTQFNLRAFHEQIMSNGIAPIRAHRMLMLPGDTGVVLR